MRIIGCRRRHCCSLRCDWSAVLIICWGERRETWEQTWLVVNHERKSLAGKNILNKHVLAPTKPRLLKINFEIFSTLKAVLRIPIRSGFNWLSGSGFRQAKMSHKQEKSERIFCSEMLNVLFGTMESLSRMPKNKFIAIWIWYKNFTFSDKLFAQILIVKILDLVPRSGFTKKPSSASGFTKKNA